MRGRVKKSFLSETTTNLNWHTLDFQDEKMSYSMHYIVSDIKNTLLSYYDPWWLQNLSRISVVVPIYPSLLRCYASHPKFDIYVRNMQCKSPSKLPDLNTWASKPHLITLLHIYEWLWCRQHLATTVLQQEQKSIEILQTLLATKSSIKPKTFTMMNPFTFTATFIRSILKYRNATYLSSYPISHKTKEELPNKDSH